MPICDIRDYGVDHNRYLSNYSGSTAKDTPKGSVHVIGGMIGELIITFTAIMEYILANPSFGNFTISADQFESFLVNLFVDSKFAPSTCNLILARHSSQEEDPEKRDNESTSLYALEPENNVNFGLRFLL